MTHSVHTKSARNDGAPVAKSQKMTFGNVFVSEWLKLWWLRSTKWSAASLIVLSWVTAIFIGVTKHEDFYPLTSVDLGQLAGQMIAEYAASGWIFLAVPMALIGIFAITSEFGSGMMRSTMNAVPNRDLLFAAKALSLTLSALLVAVITVFGTAGIAAAITARERFTWLLTSEVMLSLSLTVLTLVTVALCSLFVGWLVRASSAAITLILGVLLLLPPLLMLLTILENKFVDWLLSLLPSTLSSKLIISPFLISSAEFSSSLFLVFGLLGWLAPLGISAWLVQRRRAVQ